MRPICVKCQREMIPTKNEVLVKDKAVGEFPATMRYGDLYECPECGAEIVTGFGRPTQSTGEALEFTR